MTTPCRICEDNLVNRHKRLQICDSCYSGINYWRSRSVGDLVKHDAKLTRLKKRAAFLMGQRTNQVVAPIAAAGASRRTG
ncbi:MAG: hypothetical protein AAGG11_03755 [Pseudomonadota bacterium]